MHEHLEKISSATLSSPKNRKARNGGQLPTMAIVGSDGSRRVFKKHSPGVEECLEGGGYWHMLGFVVVAVRVPFKTVM